MEGALTEATNQSYSSLAAAVSDAFAINHRNHLIIRDMASSHLTTRTPVRRKTLNAVFNRICTGRH